VETVFINVGTNRWDLGDLVSQWIEVLSLEGGTTASAMCRLDLEGLAELLGGDQRAGVALVTGLSSTLASGRRSGRPPLELDVGRVGRGRLGRIGGIQVEPRLQLGDPLFQRGNDSQDGRLGFGRNGVPE
jgi:hypothetical protein